MYDIIIFTSGRTKSLKMIMKVLSTYESLSGQLVNKKKSHLLLSSNAFKSTYDRVKNTYITSFMQKQDPVTYLGYLLYIGWQRVTYFSNIVTKVIARIST